MIASSAYIAQSSAAPTADGGSRGRCSCLARPDEPCRGCAARRRVAARMRDEGRTLDQIARAMRVSALHVLRLLEASDDREAQQPRGCDTIPVGIVRDLYDAWHAVDPTRRTYRELARRAGYDASSTVQRLLGVIPTSSVTNRGVRYPGRIHTTISCENAARLVRAMGHLPCEIAGL